MPVVPSSDPRAQVPWAKFPYAIFVGGYTRPLEADPYGVPHDDKPVANGIQICQVHPTACHRLMC